ncbi:helix-turn-helix domain-containing protein [Streptomyces longwoodensis]|uniref:helix-turn-helix domain-containing protein n=1 Tax=Streptomyces longwoodensis TaxID=68231 RepID=UPI00224CB48C|nr:helix-turn-helix domain-containing protein [Streptomyces longwoodensis]MCX4994305.1 XRE family transcriptional regulator [Streptomyces longwoodensis]
MADQEQTEDLAQLLARLKDHYGVNDSEIARRIGVAPSTVNSWTNRLRGGKRGVRPGSIRALAAAFPAFTEDEIAAAAGREAPGPLSAEAEARVIELYRSLTEEQQRVAEAQLRALNDLNRAGN